MKILFILTTTLILSQTAFANGECGYLSKRAVEFTEKIHDPKVTIETKFMYMGLFFDKALKLRVERYKVTSDSPLRFAIYEVEHDDLTCEVTKIKLLKRY